MDDIQQKLALIDKQLTGGVADFHKRIISTAPLLFVAVGLIAGILIQDEFGLPVWFWLTGVGACAAATVISYVVYRGREGKLPYILAYTALVCFVCLGGIRLRSYEQPASNDIRNLVAEERKLATIRGSIITEPYVNKNEGWAFAKFTHTDPTSSFYLKLGEVETITGWAKVSGTVRVQVDEPVLDLKAGDYIQAYCWLDRFEKATNPGQFDVAKYLAQKNIFIAASVKSRDGIDRLAQNDKWSDIFANVKTKLKNKATQALLGDLSIEEPSQGLLEALLLGYRENIDSKTYNAFRKTGLLHFICLSGLHLGILTGIIWWLCKTAGLGKRTQASVCIIALAVFLLIVPPRVPVLRAAIICFVFCVSIFFRRKSNPLNTLSLAAIVLLLIRPTELFEAGWQLSFAAVLGIILFTDRIEGFLYEKATDNFWIGKILKTKLFFLVPPALGSYLLRLFSMGLAAWVGGAGVLLYHFYTINPLTSIWTVIAFPLVAGVLTIGFLKIILSFLLPTLAAVLGVIVTGLADLLIWIVKLFACLDISQILIGYVSPALIIPYYCFVLFAFFVYFRRPLIKKAVCAVMVLVMIVFLGVTKWQRTYRDELIVTSLDVGHGQAILAQLPGKDNILFDAGSLSKSDIGRRIVAPFLDYSGINKVDCIVISHKDIDHINGIPEIVEYCDVNDIYASDAFLADMKTDPNGTAKFLETLLNKNDFKIKGLENLNLNSAAKIKILWPNKKAAYYEQLSGNNESLVSLIQFGDVKILLCSDIEKFAQAELLGLYPDLKADVVVVPHHGSRETAEQHFLEKLNADILIVSCSQKDYERQQAVRAENETKLFYTARDGAIAICVKRDGTIKLVNRD